MALEEDLTFEEWTKAVSRHIHERFKLTLDDLPDMNTRDAYDNGVTPWEFFEDDVLALMREEFGPTVDEISETHQRDDHRPRAHNPLTNTSAERRRPMGQWINFADIRSRVSLEDVLVRLYGLTNLKRDGDKLIGPCPVHGGDSPRAFHADLTKNVWHCFTKCQGGGNQLDLVAKKEGVGIRDAALKLQAHFLVEGAKPSAPTPPASPTPVPSSPTTAPANAGAEESDDGGNNVLSVHLQLAGDHPHLVTDRGLKSETIAAFGVGYCSRGILRGMIGIPIHDEDGDLVAYAGRRLKPSDIREHGKYKLPKGFRKERVLYRFHAAKDAAKESGLIVVEGFFAAMKLFEAGLPNVVATMGVEVSAYQAKLLATAKDVVVLFDGDEAGQQGAAKIKEQLGTHLPVRIVRLPVGAKPDQLPPKMLRWLVNGMRQLDLVELAYTPNVSPSSP